MCPQIINNKIKEKVGPSWANTLKPTVVNTLFGEINIENRKTMMYDDISSLLQESIVRWHKLLIISWTKSFKSQNNIKFRLCFIHADSIEDEAKDLL